MRIFDIHMEDVIRDKLRETPRYLDYFDLLIKELETRRAAAKVAFNAPCRCPIGLHQVTVLPDIYATWQAVGEITLVNEANRHRTYTRCTLCGSEWLSEPLKQENR